MTRAPAAADDVVEPRARAAARHRTRPPIGFTRKGRSAARGRWTIVVQADAPLDAVAAVVRGVQRRSDGACAGLQLASGDAWSRPRSAERGDFRAIVDGVGTDPRERRPFATRPLEKSRRAPRPATDDISGRVGDGVARHDHAVNVAGVVDRSTPDRSSCGGVIRNGKVWSPPTQPWAPT